MLRKRIVAICLTLALMTGTILILTTSAADNGEHEGVSLSGISGSLKSPVTKLFEKMLIMFDTSNVIKSDNISYHIRQLKGKDIMSELSGAEALPVVGDRETLLKLLLDRGALYDHSNYYNGGRDGFARGDIRDELMPVLPISEPSFDMQESAPAESPGTGAGDGGHSQTNEQVEGVSEGDIVKTDGRYIYAMSSQNSTIRIIQADGPEMKVVSTIKFDGYWSREFYLIGEDRLVVIGNEYVPVYVRSGVSADVPADDFSGHYYGWYGNN